MKTYRLESSQTDRNDFDEMIERFADAALNALGEGEVLAVDPNEYTALSWDGFGIELAHMVDDEDEAKGRFFNVFPAAVTEWQRSHLTDKLDDELNLETTGHTTYIEVIPGGQQDGLDYNPVTVDIVVLDPDGDTIAYRISTDAQDEEWQIGSVDDAVDACFDYRSQAQENDIEVAMMAAQ